MKVTPLAEYLQRKGPAETPAAPSAAAVQPRRNGATNDDREPMFRKSGLRAALSRHSSDGPALVRPVDASFAFRRPPPPSEQPSPPPPEPEVDLEAKLAEAYHRGVQEGLDAAKAEALTARALERAELQKSAVIENLDFEMNEYARLSETIAGSFIEIERRIADVAARLLKPLLVKEVEKQIVDELAENVGRLSSADVINPLKVTGPKRLLSTLKGKIDRRAFKIKYVAEEGIEISVNAQSTEIRSDLAAWLQLIDDLLENG